MLLACVVYVQIPFLRARVGVENVIASDVKSSRQVSANAKIDRVADSSAAQGEKMKRYISVCTSAVFLAVIVLSLHTTSLSSCCLLTLILMPS